jgi:catechol 2,3-dioxygenase-like lactoylglutathione lyase family enzyme
MAILGIEHILLAMPIGGEDAARGFYSDILGLPEVPMPGHLAARGGCWFGDRDVKVHLGVESDFRPARKAHPAFLVSGLSVLAERLRDAGYRLGDDAPLEGFSRLFVDDPFGNRIELLERSTSS